LGAPLLAAFPARGPVASRRGGVSPYSGGTVPDSHRRSLNRSPILTGRDTTTGRLWVMEAQVLRGRSPLLTVWLPIVLWAGLIFALSSIPSLHSGLGTWDLILRKCAHV